MKKSVKKNSKKHNTCKKHYQKLLSKLNRMGKLHVKYGSRKIKLNIGCPEIKKRKKRKMLPPSIYNI